MPDHDPERPSPSDDTTNPYAPPEADLSPVPRATPIFPGGEPFSPGRVVERAWVLFKERLGLVFGLVNVPIWIYLIYQFIGEHMAETVDKESVMGMVAQGMFTLSGLVIQVWLTSGTTMALIKVARGQEAQVADIFQGGPYVVRIIGASLLYALGIFLLMAFCLAPGGLLYLAGNMVGGVIAAVVGFMVTLAVALLLVARFYQYSYLVIDQDARVIESLRGSFQITRGHTLEVLGLLLLGIFVGTAGLLACVVGYFFTMAWAMLLFACIYVALIDEHPGGLGKKADEADLDFDA
jgi:hypothetical protein